jgi:hypothetical protein
MAGGMAEKKLAAYRDYLHHVSSAMGSLPTFVGRVNRGAPRNRTTSTCPPLRPRPPPPPAGINVKLSPGVYAVGKTITWQQLSSASKKQLEAINFVDKQA